jgi:hypothetical protein
MLHREVKGGVNRLGDALACSQVSTDYHVELGGPGIRYLRV